MDGKVTGVEESAVLLERWNDWRDLLRFVLNHCENAVPETAGAGVGNRSTNDDKLNADPTSGVGDVLEPLAKKIQSARDKANEFVTKSVSDAAHFSVLAQSLVYYIRSSLASSEIEQFDENIDSVTSGWFREMMGLPASSAGYFYQDENKARLFVTHACLHSKFPDYGTQGYNSFNGSEPVIYLCETFSFVGENLAFSMGLPKKCVRLISTSHGGGNGSMDLDILEDHIQRDKAEGRLPMLIIASADINHPDDLPQIREICNKNNLWLHVEGDGLMMLYAKSKCPSILATSTQADSFIINPSRWYDLPTTTAWTCLKQPVSSELKNAYHIPLTSLPWWMYIKRDGRDSMEKSIISAIELSDIVIKRLEQLPSIKITNVSPPAVLFRYEPNFPEAENKLGLVNNLNRQILLDLSTNQVSSALNLSPLNSMDDKTTWICFQPLLTKDVTNVDQHVVDRFIEIISLETSLIDSAIECRPALIETVSQLSDLTVVEVDNFIGLGAVRYVPSYLIQSLGALSPEVAVEIDNINKSLAGKLSSDPLYAATKNTKGEVCVSLGVDTKPFTPQAVEDYVVKLHNVAKQIELSSDILEKIAQTLQKKIKEAENQRVQEEAKILYEEGIIRKLPFGIGSVWNYLNPIEKKSLSGRSFSLASNEITSSPKTKTGSPSRLQSSSSASVGTDLRQSLSESQDENLSRTASLRSSKSENTQGLSVNAPELNSAEIVHEVKEGKEEEVNTPLEEEKVQSQVDTQSKVEPLVNDRQPQAEMGLSQDSSTEIPANDDSDRPTSSPLSQKLLDRNNSATEKETPTNMDLPSSPDLEASKKTEEDQKEEQEDLK